MTSEPSTIDALLKQGIAAARAGRKDEARQQLLQIIELDEENEQAWLWLSGVVESDADRRVCLENVLTINPANAAAQKGLRLLDERAPKPHRERCPHCKAELPSTGNFCTACHQPVLIACPNCRGYVEIVTRKCTHCGTLLGDYHDRNNYYLGLADAYLQHDNFPLAQWATEQVGLGVPDAEALSHMAELYLHLGKPERTVDLYRQASERDPQNVAPYLKLADLYRQQDRREEMQEVYRAALRHLPEQPEILRAWAQAVADRRDSINEAIDLLERVLQQQPDDDAAHLLLARLYNRSDNPVSATTHYRRTVALAAPGSGLAAEAQRELTQLHHNDPDGWGEFTRHALGLMLCPICAALANAQLSPLKIDLLSWALLGVSLVASVLWISSADMPRNPITLKVFGPHEPQRLNSLGWSSLAKSVWAVAFIIIVFRA
ncbi:MAG TPA: tetratricopeptide repeat protein [Anaerolineae bacterium]|nr:tetratricopeptide repeat protein [Anaerolineae bacterium]